MGNRKKIKSGAQKAREKSMKLQMEQAKKCRNIASFFPLLNLLLTILVIMLINKTQTLTPKQIVKN